LYEILRNPAIYAELQTEIDKAPTEMQVSDLTAVEGPLQYTNAVISEALRLHPPVPLEIHENTTSAPIALADGSLVGPAEIVLWSPWAMGRSTRIWGEDAADFKPSRWFPEVQLRTADGTNITHPLKKSAFEFPVFHAGPRSCLGKNLARIELAYALVQLVKRYDMVPTWPINQDKSVGTALTAPILGGLGVRARHRRKM
jgi:cytochrome P450